MAKEKFHTSHHTERRYHKNGIKKVTKTKYVSLVGVKETLTFRQCNAKTLRNRRRGIHFDKRQNKHYKVKTRRVVVVTQKAPAKKEGKKDAAPKKDVAPKEHKKEPKKDVKKDIKKEAKKEEKKIAS